MGGGQVAALKKGKKKEGTSWGENLLFLHKEYTWIRMNLLKHKSLTAISTSLSTMKFDCNPKYTIPYVKVCDNI